MEDLRSVAKVTAPSIAEDHPRERLFEALDEGRTRTLTWVCGPGGAGKTHLLSSYIKRRRREAIWYHVDHGDTDVASLFYYLGLAARKYTTGSKGSLPLLSSHHAEDLSRFTFRFFEELFQQFPQQGLLVFDNLQEVHENAPLYRVIQETLSRVPTGMSIVVISRNEPPAGFASLTAARTMKVLKWQDVRFTAAEFAGTARVLGTGILNDADIRQLHQELEGWVAGLVLTLEQVKLSGKGSVRPRRGTIKEVFDFFVAEIWDAVQPETRDFLIKTANFPFLTGVMAEELTGTPNAEEILSRLSANNFFTLRFEPGPRYRYHNLFREFLVLRQKDRLFHDDIAWLKKNAAALLYQEGYPEESAELLIEGKDWNGLAALVKQAAPVFFDQGRIHTVQGWLQRLPQAVRDEYPWLIYWQARCAINIDPPSRRALYQRSFKLFEDNKDPDGMLLSWAGKIMTYLHSQQGLESLDQLIRDFDDLHTYFDNSCDQYVRFQVASSMFVAITFRQPTHPDALTWERLVREGGGTIPDLNTYVHFLLGTALRQYFTGNITGFERALGELEGSMGNPDRLLPNNRTMYPMLQAIYKWLKFELDECQRHVAAGLKVSDEAGGTIWDGLLLGQQVNASLSEGNLREAKKGLELYRSYLYRLPPLSVSYYHQRMAWYCLAKGDVDEALDYANEGHDQAIEAGIPNNLGYALILKAEAHLALGETDTAEQVLHQACKVASDLGNALMDFQCALLNAGLSYSREGDLEGDIKLAEALKIGRKNGILNWQFLSRQVVTKLLVTALDRGIEVDYVSDLIQRWETLPEGDLWNLEAWPWPFKVFTLGRFEVLLNGEPLSFEGKVQQRPMELLKAIIALGGRGVAAERLIEVLWPDSAGDAGHRTLETNLHRLRKILGLKDAVELRDGCLTLDQRKWWVDIWAFERAFSENGTAPGDETYRKAERSMELYKGAFLPSTTQAWTVAARERIENKFIRLVDRYGTFLEQQGKTAMAIDCYLSALDRCPVSEKLYQNLMLCYEKMGQKVEAVAVYERCHNTLMAEYGIKPGRKIIELCQRIKGGSEPYPSELSDHFINSFSNK